MDSLHEHTHPASAAPVPGRGVDEAHMRRALELARRALGYTRPNPMVGAVVVADGEVIGTGFHRRCGSAHAETIALANAGARARGATLYVTLEPCSHHGRTPPCVDAIIDADIARVVIPTLDPDPLVFGNGVERLRAHGIRVDVGVLEAETVARNLDYYRDRLRVGPTVTLKMAVTMDGKIAAARGRRSTITGPAAHRFVHRLRAASDCVVVGVDTVLVDEPQLDCRFLGDVPGEEPSPTPVVLDTHLRTPARNRWSQAGRPYVVLCGPDADPARERALVDTGARVIRCALEGPVVSVRAAIDALGGMGFDRILVEGGAGVFSSFVDAAGWHTLYLFRSQGLFGESGVALYRGEGPDVTGALVDQERIGDDTLQLYVERAGFEEVLARVAGRER